MFIIVLFLTLLISDLAWSTSYYVSTSGSDSNNGTSAITPWQTVSKVNASSFTAGDTVYFKRGETWREILVMPSSGSSGSPITIDAYGTGDYPKFIGSDIVAGGSFSVDSGFSYSISYTLIATGTMMVWEDGVRLTLASNQAEVRSTPGRFFSSGGTTYISASDGSDPRTNGKVYEVPGRVRLIYTNGKNYITIRHVEVLRSSGDDTTYGGIMVSGNDNIVEYVISHDHRRHCVQITSETGISAQRNIVRYSTLYDSYATFVISVFHQAVATVVSSGNQITDNTISTVNTTGKLITVHGADATHQVDSTIVQRNVLISANTAGGPGNEFYDLNGLLFSGNWITGRYSSNPVYVRLRGSGIILSANFLNMTGVLNTVDGFFIQDITGVIVAHNFFYGANSRHPVRFFTNATGATVANNIFYGTSKTMRVDTTAQSGFVSNYNIAYNIALSSQWGQWGATEYTLANWITNSSQDANTLTSDPVVTIDSNIFTASNLFPLRTSPAYHAGMKVLHVRDARGFPYSISTRPTIGPYEYGSRDLAATRTNRQ